VLLKFTDVSEVFAASIIRAMEAASTFETSENFYTRLHRATTQKTAIITPVLFTTVYNYVNVFFVTNLLAPWSTVLRS
jgi:hypothetical protein